MALSRRAFGFGVFGTASLLVLGGLPLGWMLVDELRFLDAAVEACFPPVPGLPTAAEVGASKAIQRTLEAVPASVALQARGLFRAIEGLPLLSHGKPFSSLSQPQRTAILQDLAESSLYPRRLLAHGLKQMCAMGYWQNPRTWSHLGYDGPLVGR